MFNNLLASLNDFLYSYILIFLLVAAGIYFSIRTKFVQFRLISDAIKALKEKAENNDNGKYHTDCLCQYGCNGRSCDIHMESCDQHEVSDNIDHTGNGNK